MIALRGVPRSVTMARRGRDRGGWQRREKAKGQRNPAGQQHPPAPPARRGPGAQIRAARRRRQAPSRWLSYAVSPTDIPPRDNKQPTVEWRSVAPVAPLRPGAQIGPEPHRVRGLSSCGHRPPTYRGRVGQWQVPCQGLVPLVRPAARRARPGGARARSRRPTRVVYEPVRPNDKGGVPPYFSVLLYRTFVYFRSLPGAEPLVWVHRWTSGAGETVRDHATGK